MPPTTQRFLALDVLRGMTICFMIIVNTPGGPNSYSPLNHAAWNGFTPTDLVFPSFMFVVGNAMSFVMAKWETQSSSAVLLKILKRTLLIFLLGYLMYWFPFFQQDDSGHWSLSPVSQTRILGVLQRIALAYGIASLMLYYLKPRVSVILTLVILFLYWPVMMLFGDPHNPLGMTTNIGTRIDLMLMSDGHMYHGEGVAFEPEGWLGTLPSIGNVIGGFLVGRFVQQKGKTWEGLAKLMLAGFALMVVAYFWDTVFPINKKLWTSSFVLYTVGLDCIILSGIIYVIEFLHKTRWTKFFEVFGKNPLFIYLLSELGATIFYLVTIGKMPLHNWLYETLFKPTGLYFGSLLYAVFFMLLCWVVGYWLDKRKIYVRV